MKNTTPLVLVLAVLLGAAGGALTSLLLGPSSTTDVRRTEAAAPDLDTATEIRELQARYEEILERLRALEVQRPAPVREPVGDFVSRAELDALREELLGHAVAGSVTTLSPVLREQVEGVLAELEERYQLTRDEKMRAARLAERKDQAAAYTHWLTLDVQQSRELSNLLDARIERQREVAAWREAGATHEQLASAKDEEEQQFRDAFRRLLTPDQLALFNTKYANDPND